MKTNKDKMQLVLGASTKPDRYSFKAYTALKQAGYPVLAIGARAEEGNGVKVETEIPAQTEIDTLTLYLSPKNQLPMYDKILSLSPRRIIFNPGTENEELENMAKAKGIEVEEACTLVLLATDQY